LKRYLVYTTEDLKLSRLYLRGLASLNPQKIAVFPDGLRKSG
jgi:hypothetical protein